ncbi:MAG: hypothetical protein E6H58_13270 [Betaproteobacteria bacterium]|nr:MAG: hypothetical protein E6H65_17430 [Betaproteobacteria bacterium]TMH30907.1 MAG: hypothetical protein E6H58_13270 [Betaproteobacteria bacterium]
MFNRPPPKPPGFPDSIDFELTDFADARHALDEVPPGVIEVQQLKPGYWEQRRRKSVATDKALTGGSLDWIMGMPPELRPAVLADRYPRVVNMVAAAWTDVERCITTLDELIVDHRGGRKGFSVEVDSELRALRRYRIALGR